LKELILKGIHFSFVFFYTMFDYIY